MDNLVWINTTGQVTEAGIDESVQEIIDQTPFSV